MFTSHSGTVRFDETMPSFSSPGWAAWVAFRMLHPAVLLDFERDLQKLFDDYKVGSKKWLLYNEEKRMLLQRYMTQPYDPKKWKRK